MSTGDVDCAGTARAVAAFVAGELGVREQARLRAHRNACPACESAWRESLASVATLQSRERRGRSERARLARRAANRRMAFSASGEASDRATRARRRAQLRLVLLPALAIVLMLVIHPLGRERRARLEVLAGEVELSANRYRPADPPVPLVRGDRCATGDAGRARIDGAGVVVELEERTLLLVEDELEGRFRLDSGSLRVEGDGTVTSRFGVVEVVAGEASLRLVPGGLELDARAGRVVATNGLGAREIAPGTHAVVAYPR